jgi:arylsulfatase A-like enzyme
MFSEEIKNQLKKLDKLPYRPKPRDIFKNPPERALLVITDGITPGAFAGAHTPTFDKLAKRGVSSTDARSVFPTITGPAHTSLLTGARVGTHGFLYPKMLDAFGNRLEDFNEGLMRAETIAEAWRPNGIVSIGIGSRFLRGADMMITEGIVGGDLYDIRDRAIDAVRAFKPHLLMVVFYVADTMGHLYGPEAPETLAAVEEMDKVTGSLLDAYSEEKMLDQTVIAVMADHGMAQVDEVVDPFFVERVGALPHGRLALSPHALTGERFDEMANDSRVEDIWGREELTLLGAWGPEWGEQVIQLKTGLMFPHTRELRGYHGAWSESEQRIPLIISGPGISAGAALGTCELIDLAPTLSLLLGGECPSKAEGRVL